MQRSEGDKLVWGAKSNQKQGLFLLALCGWPSIHTFLLHLCTSGVKNELFLAWWTEEGMGVQEICDTPKEARDETAQQSWLYTFENCKHTQKKVTHILGKYPVLHYRIPVTGKTKQNCRKKINRHKDLLYSTGNTTQYSAITYIRKESKKSGYMYMYNWFILLYIWN